MKKILGYSITGVGNENKGMLESYVAKEEDYYSNLYDLNYLNPKYKIGSKCRKYDFSVTYDGYDIASQKLVDFCKVNKYENIQFIKLQNEENHYWMKVHNVVEFDFIKKGCLFEKYSNDLNKYWGVYRATPVILKNNLILKDGFYRTDLCFGDGYTKSPVIIVGKETRKKIKEAKLTGIYFEEIVEV